MSDKNIQKIITRTIVEHNGKILIVRRSASDKTRAGVWELPGGSVDEGESLEDAAVREVKEEAGLDITDVTFLRSDQYIHPDGSRRLGAVFHALTKGNNVSLSFEHDDSKWISISNINNTDFEEKHKQYTKEYYDTDKDSDKHKNSDDKSTSNTRELIVYTDGGSRGNPGPSATGYVIMDSQKRILVEGGQYLGITTNNQAEYQAVKVAMNECIKLGARSVEFFIDSMLVVNQMNGTFKVKNRDLWPIHEDINKMATKFESVGYTHVRREKNALADAKVNEVLDNYPK